MRELKFRMWAVTIPNNKERMLTSGDVANLYLGLDVQKSVNGILMQYTGLKDKNGKEIYEGDIVRGPSEIDVVKWDVYIDSDSHASSGFLLWGFRSIQKHPCDVSEDDPVDCEVIGNIYENPDLLKT